MSENTISDLAAHCIRCGFCLESCPTFALTGKETESPRGRIYLIRNADSGHLDWDGEVAPHLDTCLGCRACETACPSGVEYGALLELARSNIRSKPARDWLLGGLTDRGLLRLQLVASRLASRSGKLPRFVSRAIAGQDPQAQTPVPQAPSGWPKLDLTLGKQVLLLEGCAMGVLFPRVHEATHRLLARLGFTAVPLRDCCGALHAHAGKLDQARAMAHRLVASAPGDAPVVVNSAGCGSAMKEYGLMDGDPVLAAFARRVVDVSEFLWRHGLRELIEQSPGLAGKATYHDACHLAHGQGVRTPPRSLLGAIPGLDWVPLPESDMCCGSAGTYNLFQPNLARRLLDRKWANVTSTGATLVAMGNPGCHAWLAQAARETGSGLRVFHTVELLESSFSGLPPT